MLRGRCRLRQRNTRVSESTVMLRPWKVTMRHIEAVGRVTYRPRLAIVDGVQAQGLCVGVTLEREITGEDHAQVPGLTRFATQVDNHCSLSRRQSRHPLPHRPTREVAVDQGDTPDEFRSGPYDRGIPLDALYPPTERCAVRRALTQPLDHVVHLECSHNSMLPW